MKAPSKGLFITGTDTDVGKTFIACCIAINLRLQHQSVSPRKPIASGCIQQNQHTLLSKDAQLLKTACQSKESLETICPYRFKPAISPQQAIQQAKQSITILDLKKACKVNQCSIALIEGAGGFYSPIASNGLNKDLAIQLKYPVVLVVANKIGCINHTLLTIKAIQEENLKLHSIIINNTIPNSFNYAEDLKAYTNINIYHTPFSKHHTPQPIKNWRFD